MLAFDKKSRNFLMPISHQPWQGFLSQKLNGVRGTSQIMTVAIPLKTALILKALCLEKSLPRLMRNWH
jgi:hypothetical protein